MAWNPGGLTLAQRGATRGGSSGASVGRPRGRRAPASAGEKLANIVEERREAETRRAAVALEAVCGLAGVEVEAVRRVFQAWGEPAVHDLRMAQDEWLWVCGELGIGQAGVRRAGGVGRIASGDRVGYWMTTGARRARRRLGEEALGLVRRTVEAALAGAGLVVSARVEGDGRSARWRAPLEGGDGRDLSLDACLAGAAEVGQVALEAVRGGRGELGEWARGMAMRAARLRGCERDAVAEELGVSVTEVLRWEVLLLDEEGTEWLRKVQRAAERVGG